MTAINVFRLPDMICVFTDGAQYEPDGTLFCSADKVDTIAHCNAVLAARGSPMLTTMVNKYLGMASSNLEEAILRLPVEIMKVLLAYNDIFKDGLATNFEVVIAGWSEASNSGQVFTCFGDERARQLGIEPWKMHEAGPIVLAPCSDPADFEGIICPGSAVNVFDAALEIMELQRKISERTKSGELVYGVGCFAQLTTVSAKGIHKQILRRWPDKIGEKLGTLSAG